MENLGIQNPFRLSMMAEMMFFFFFVIYLYQKEKMVFLFFVYSLNQLCESLSSGSGLELQFPMDRVANY